MINNQIARKHKVTIDSTNQNENISFSIAVLKNGEGANYKDPKSWHAVLTFVDEFENRNK